MQNVLNWLQRRADNVAVALLTAIFLSFMLQIFSRYVIRQPLGWTLEANLLAWLWLVFWASAFTLKEKDHVRFTILVDSARPKTRRIYMLITAVSVIAALAVSLPATFDFVSFMKIEKTSLLKIRFDFVFSIYLIFSVAIIARYVWRVVEIFRDRDRNNAG
ncbi:MAG: C4-dicarboxylate ABC transporter permease [Marinosulfonomonas sp.]|nr:MAG: C4-dicarboxylate ABC transporter permease [Marinosulfonomonas sp.]